MNGKELLFSVLRHEETPRAAWVPFAGVHAGALIGADAEQTLTQEDTLVAALLEVNRLYMPDGQPVVFDLQLEAEALGCELLWAKYGPPSIKTHPLAETMHVPCYCTLPKETSKRIPLVLSAMRRMKAAVGETTALYGLVCGPFTLASHLRGNDLFMDMYDDESFVDELLAYCTECAKRMAGYYIGSGMDVIAVVDPLVSQISTAHFARFLHQPYMDIFSHINQNGAFSSFFVCGDATRNIEEMCLTKPDSISVDENVAFAAAKAITDRHDVALGGNIPLTSVMLHGTQQDNIRYVVELQDQLGAAKNLVIAPGCDMPYAVPPENTIGAAQAVLHKEESRVMIANYTPETFDLPVELPDYAHLKKPLMEVFTLDSATCAACTYMMAAANEAKARFGERIDVAEYKFTEKENIARCMKMGVKNLPSIYINGTLRFSSLIPSRGELDAAVESALLEIG
ncbi:MAG: uroporphyrinogen decarboxylase family protein [Clostridiaceae bacterium]